MRITVDAMEKAFYNVSEVAQIIGLGRSLTYRLVSEGSVPSVFLAGRRSRRVAREDLARWIEDQRAHGAGRGA